MQFNFSILGTVIASVLEYDHLIKITKDPAIIDPKVSVWIPADGRDISHSDLAEATGNNKCPDFRGLFMRGLNTFYSNGQQNIDPQHADPDNTRHAGDVQLDAVQKHTHPFSHMLQVSPGEPHNGGGSFNHNGGGSEGYNNYGVIPENNINSDETRPKNCAVYYYIRINQK